MLAVAVLAGSAGAVLAHALPGSVLLLRKQGDALELTIQFPVEDLVVAAPDLAALEALPAGQPVRQDLSAALGRYLGQHLSVTEDAAPLNLTMIDARIQSAYHDHLGHFALIVSQWRIEDVGDLSTAPTLTYDAVMHEVRNHRATVLWNGPDGGTHQISEFGYLDAGEGTALVPPDDGLERRGSFAMK